MNFTFTFNLDQIKIILASMDGAPHGQVRPIIDYIVAEANKQQISANEAAQAAREEVE